MIYARIYQPTKTAMQAGRAQARAWILEFVPQQKYHATAPMGWTGSGDMLQQIRLKFTSCDAAKAYATAQGIPFQVSEPHGLISRPKSYADNFRHNRVL